MKKHTMRLRVGISILNDPKLISILRVWSVVRSHLALPFATSRWSSSSACRRWSGAPRTPLHWSPCGWSCCSSRLETGRWRLSSSQAAQCNVQLCRWGPEYLLLPRCPLTDKWQLPRKLWKPGQISSLSCFECQLTVLCSPCGRRTTKEHIHHLGPGSSWRLGAGRW